MLWAVVPQALPHQTAVLEDVDQVAYVDPPHLGHLSGLGLGSVLRLTDKKVVVLLRSDKAEHKSKLVKYF